MKVCGREHIWSTTLKMLLDHPIFGVGFGGFQQAILTTYSDFIPPGRATTLPHTSSVAILAELGIVGGVMAVVLFGSLFVEAWRKSRRLVERWPVAAMSVALVAILIESQFAGRLFEEPYLWVLLGLFYGAAARPVVVLSRKPATEQGGPRSPAPPTG